MARPRKLWGLLLPVLPVLLVLPVLPLLPAVALAEPLPIEWVAPTQNVDGSPLTDLEQYRVLWGDSSRQYSESLLLEDETLTSYTLDVSPGQYYVAMTAIDADGNESAQSNEVLKVVSAVPGSTVLGATWEFTPSGGPDVAWTYIGDASAGNSGEATGIITITHGLGASIQAGDLLVLSVHTNFNMGADGPPDPEPHTNALESDGWTYPLQNGEATGESMANWVGYKVATASEPASYSFDMKTNTTWGMHLYVARPGSGLSWAYDVDSGLTSTGSGSGTNPIAESITLSQADSIAFALAGHDAGSSISITAVDNSYTDVSTDNIRGYGAYRIFTASGPTGDTTFTANTTNRGDYAFHIGFYTTAGGTVFNDSVTEALQVSSSNSPAANFSTSVSDGVSAGESQGSDGVFPVSISEGTSLGDSPEVSPSTVPTTFSALPTYHKKTTIRPRVRIVTDQPTSTTGTELAMRRTFSRRGWDVQFSDDSDDPPVDTQETDLILILPNASLSQLDDTPNYRDSKKPVLSLKAVFSDDAAPNYLQMGTSDGTESNTTIPIFDRKKISLPFVGTGLDGGGSDVWEDLNGVGSSFGNQAASFQADTRIDTTVFGAVWEKGDKMDSGFVAPARRAFLGISENVYERNVNWAKENLVALAEWLIGGRETRQHPLFLNSGPQVFEAALAEALVVAASQSATITSEVTVVEGLQVDASEVANAVYNVVYSQGGIFGDNNIGGLELLDEVTEALQLGDSSTSDITQEVAYVQGMILGAAQTAQAELETAISEGAGYGATVTSQVALSSSVTFQVEMTYTTEGSTFVGTIQASDDRTFKVAVENRSFRVTSRDSFLIPKDDDAFKS